MQNYAPKDVLERKFRIPGGREKSLVDLSAKDMYTILMFTNDIKPKSIDYWLHKYPEVNIDFDQWFKMINMQKLGQRKSLDFNWRIFHGHINTEIKLEKMKLSDGYCKLCNTAKENLDHILIKCSHIPDVWVRIKQIVYFLGETDYMTDFNKIDNWLHEGWKVPKRCGLSIKVF